MILTLHGNYESTARRRPSLRFINPLFASDGYMPHRAYQPFAY